MSWYLASKSFWSSVSIFYVGVLTSHTFGPMIWRRGIYSGSTSYEILNDILGYIKGITFLEFAAALVILSVLIFIPVSYIFKFKTYYTPFLFGMVTGLHIYVLFFPNDLYRNFLDSTQIFSNKGLIVSILYIVLLFVGILSVPIFFALCGRFVKYLLKYS